MSTSSFTPAENQVIYRLLLSIYRIPELRPTSDSARSIQQALKRMLEEGAAPRNVMGQNRVIIALKTILLAHHEIGLRGSILKAYLLHRLADREKHLAIACEACQAEGASVLRSLSDAAALDVKTEAMRTEDFRNFFVSQVGDMRIVLLLIAECVIIMRHAKETPALAERQRISTEAAYLYAPLAHKVGLYQLKSELEDLSLKYLEHDAYYQIKEDLNATKRTRDAYIERFISPIREMLDAEGLHYHIKGRTKSIHSIWQKMKKQGCGFSGVYDLFAIRIILDAPPSKEKEQCWKVFSLITSRYESNLKRLRDWLTVPKSNGYESLHITVRGPEDKWVEVQIRTERMDDIAEHGLAAHWRYKGVKSAEAGVDDWLSDIRNALETGNENLLCESLTQKRDKKEVYVFTPKGDLYKLPNGATILDFAYHIHSEVGNHCVGGRIEGRNVPIRQKLVSGETVEIITATTQTPKAEWIGFVVSSHAKAKIRAAVRDLQARNNLLARELLERKFKNRKIEWDESIMNRLIKKLGYKESTEFYKSIAEERIDLSTLIEQYAALFRQETGQADRASIRSADEFTFEHDTHNETTNPNDVIVIDRNVKGIDFQMARCCNPVYGDDVFGFVTVGGGIKIHRKNCPNAPALRARFDYRIIKARWAGKGGGKYHVTLHIVGNDNLGIVNSITSIISKEPDIQLRSFSIDTDDGLFYGVLTVTLDESWRMKSLMEKIKNIKGVKAVSRN